MKFDLFLIVRFLNFMIHSLITNKTYLTNAANTGLLNKTYRVYIAFTDGEKDEIM